MLSAFSTPPQAGTSGNPLIFDRNAVSNTSNITHTANTADFVISTPGYYYISFHGTISPAANAKFPLTASLFLRQQGNAISGASAQHTFQGSTDSASISFTQIIQVSSVPTTLTVFLQGGTILYGEISMDIHKIANINAQNT